METDNFENVDSSSSDLSTHLDFLLKKKKRSSLQPLTSAKEYKRILGKLRRENKGLSGKQLVSESKKYIRRIKLTNRNSRGMKEESKSSTSKVNKSKSTSQRLKLELMLKRLREKKALRNKSVNYTHHPIMDYYRSRQSRRLV
jgi:hypothetical protein